jgi:hypothetical protein
MPVAVVYEPQYLKQGWFDDQSTSIAWFDEELWAPSAQDMGIDIDVCEPADHIEGCMAAINIMGSAARPSIEGAI